MKEILVISGKGGTGKTSLTAAFSRLEEHITVADCDVDAPDLHLLLKPEMRYKTVFTGGKTAYIDDAVCSRCGKCFEICQFKAITEDLTVDTISCEGCAVCSWNCPVNAIEMLGNKSGFLYESSIINGSMIHAQLDPGEENSGKLVTEVKNRARTVSEQAGTAILLIDGSPGTGCPVVASLNNVDHAVIVTEPTQSAIHDLKRTISLTDHFNVNCSVIINKYDLNSANTRSIEEFAGDKEITILGKIAFSSLFTQAITEGKTLLEIAPDSLESSQLRDIWQRLKSDFQTD